MSVDCVDVLVIHSAAVELGALLLQSLMRVGVCGRSRPFARMLRPIGRSGVMTTHGRGGVEWSDDEGSLKT